MWAEQLRRHDDTPIEDKIVVLRDVSWSDYQRVLEVRGEASVPRFAYLAIREYRAALTSGR